MSWTRQTYQEAFDLALTVFHREMRDHNRPEVIHRIMSESVGKRDTVTFTTTMSDMVKIMDLCQDVIGQQSDHPARYFPSLNRRKRS